MSKLAAQFSNLKILTNTELETTVEATVEVGCRMKRPDVSNCHVSSSLRPVDYGACNELLKEKYGNDRGQKSYEGMIDAPNSGIFFVVGAEIVKEKMVMMAALGKYGLPENHHYQGLYAQWLAK